MGRGNQARSRRGLQHDLARNARPHGILWRLPSIVRHRPSSGGGRDAGHHRRQRRGQIDISQDHRGASWPPRPKAWSMPAGRSAGCRRRGSCASASPLVPEGRRLFPSLSVEENLAIGAYGRHDGGYWSLARIYELFPALAARAAAPHRIHLSGGEQQMAAIGRALMANPRVLLCDEISLGLAPSSSATSTRRCRASRRAGPASSWSSRTSCRRCRWPTGSTASRKGACRSRGDPAELSRDQIHAAYFGA